MINDITLYIFKNLVIDGRSYAGDCMVDYVKNANDEIFYRLDKISLFKNNDLRTWPLPLDCRLPLYNKILAALVAERDAQIRKVIMNDILEA